MKHIAISVSHGTQHNLLLNKIEAVKLNALYSELSSDPNHFHFSKYSGSTSPPFSLPLEQIYHYNIDLAKTFSTTSGNRRTPRGDSATKTGLVDYKIDLQELHSRRWPATSWVDGSSISILFAWKTHIRQLAPV